MKVVNAIALLCLVPSAFGKKFLNAVYQDPSASIDARVEDLLSRMNIEEKKWQLMQGSLQDMVLPNNKLNVSAVEPYGGIFAAMIPRDPLATFVNDTQEYLMTQTRLGIPAIMQSEGIHGWLDGNATIFPAPLAMSCSFNPDLIHDVGNVIGTESSGVGVNIIMAPVLDLSRELRWGRVEENFGEDPHLTGEMGKAFITGLQGKRKEGTAKTATHRVASMVKHFVGFGSPEGGLNTAPVAGGERDMRMFYLPPFKKAIVDANAMSVMSAYHAYDGTPAAVNTHYLTDVLRGEWNFTGYVSSDAWAISNLCTQHYLCDPRFADPVAAVLALDAGNEVEMGGTPYHYLSIPDQVKKGNLKQSVVDEAVRRVLRVKFELGLFENPWALTNYNQSIHTAKSINLARQLDAESIVLLENDGVLPLSKKDTIAVIGPQAAVMQYGDYVYPGVFDRGVTPLAGLLKKVGAGKIHYAQGCELWSNDVSGIEEAVAAAKKSKVAVVMVGTWTRDQSQLWSGYNATTGEHVDVNDLGLVGAQLKLVKAVQATGVPTVVVYISGKPVAEPWIKENVNAIVQAFYPGEQGGNALADILYGDVNPSGKLSVSFPTYVGSLPAYYNFLNGGRPVDAGASNPDGTLKFGHQYVLGTPVASWYFGHGLSYTKFEYSNLHVANASLTDTKVDVKVTVKNTGKRAGKEVVQVYINDFVSSVVTPNQALKGFTKLSLKAGESKQVTVPIFLEDLAIWSVKNKYEVEAGEFVAYVGGGYGESTLNAHFWIN